MVEEKPVVSAPTSRRRFTRGIPTVSSRTLDIAVTCFALAALFTRYSKTVADLDLWGHLRFGQDLLTSGRIIRPDTYSYMTGDQVWINHEWLAEGIVALIYRTLGVHGLIAFKVLLAMSISGLAYVWLRRQGLVPLRAWALVAAASVLLVTALGMVRPYMFTYACFAILLYALMQVEHGRKGWLWVLPPLFALWPNLHGGFLAGIGIMLIWLLTYCVRLGFSTPTDRAALQPRPWMAFTTTALALLALSLNPYGLELLRFLWATATVPRVEISEWHPVEIISFPGAVYLLLMLASIVAFAHSRRPRSPFVLLAFAVLAVLPLVATRHLPLFALGVLFLAGEHIADSWQRWSESRGADKTPVANHRLFAPLLVLVLAAGSVIFVLRGIPSLDCIHVDGSFMPVRAVALLKQAQAEGDMAGEFDWGEYVIWHLGPAVRVSIDGRRETVYSSSAYQESLNFMFGVGDWGGVLRRDGVEMALVRAKQPAYNLMRQQEGWDLAYEDSVSALFVKQGSPLVEKIRAAAPRGSSSQAGQLCFP